jgi:hypothetical protein
MSADNITINELDAIADRVARLHTRITSLSKSATSGEISPENAASLFSQIAAAWHEDRKRAAFAAMEKRGGTFAQHLAAAWFAADPANSAIIENSFPELIAKYTPAI